MMKVFCLLEGRWRGIKGEGLSQFPVCALILLDAHEGLNCGFAKSPELRGSP